MDDEELEYLQPRFDLSTLKVANLRNILVKHEVEFPSSAKKAELIQYVNDGVLPMRKKLLAAHARVKRTSKGIVDVPSSQESTIDGDEDDKTLMPPPETPRRGGRRTTTKIAQMDGEDAPVEPTSRRVGRTPGRKSAPVKHPRESDTDDVPESATKRPSSRKSRKSEVPTPASPPAVMIEEPDSPPRAARRISNFTYDNPFQSGSSPPAEEKSSSKPRKRKSSLSASRDDRRKSTSRGRKTMSPTESKFKQEDGFKVPSRSTFEVPISRLGTAKTEDMSDGIDAGEEFTPEEQLALVRDRAANGHSQLLPPKRAKRSKKTSTAAKSAPWVVILTFLATFAGYWRHEKIEIGYCGVGKTSWSLMETKVPEFAHGLQPECEPCPPHAYCHPNMEVTCEPDFILTQHPLSFGGLWPLPATCEPDGEKGRRVQAVAARAIEELRERRAKWECGDLVDAKGKEVKVEMPEQELKKEVAKKRRRGMSEQEFEDLWQGALGEIKGRDEVISDSAGTSSIQTLTSTSLARVPFTCNLKRSVRLTLARYRLQFAGVMVLIISSLYARSSIRAMKSDSARIPELVSMTLDRLATQAVVHSNNPSREGFISVGQLRDDVLRGEFSAKRREKMWKGVRSVIEDNTNVRAAVKESRSGEVSRVWEWIGDTSNLELEDRRSSGRIPRGNEEINEEVERPEREMEMRRWDEGRPIY